MKYFWIIFLCSFSLFASDWKANIAELAPELLIDFANQKGLATELQKSFEKNSGVAGPLKTPLARINFVQDKGIKTPNQSLSFKQGVHHPKLDFAVYRYSSLASDEMRILAKIQHGKLFKTYLNGKLLSQHSSGLLFHSESPYQTLKLKKGRNDLVFISITKQHHIPHLRVSPYSEQVKMEFEKDLSRFDQLKQGDLEEWLNIQLALRPTDLFEAQAHGLGQILKLDYRKLSQGKMRHFFHMGVHPRVMAKIMGSVENDKLVDWMVYINQAHIKSYFDVLAIEGRGKEIVQFFKLYAQKYDPKNSYSWGNNLYNIGEFLLMQGDTKSAHAMFQIFEKFADQKNKTTQKNIEYALIESQDDSGIRPRFSADPEVEVFVNDLNRLFKQKPERDVLAQIYKIIRAHQAKLFSRDYQLYSLKTYFQQKLKGKNDFAAAFSTYIQERYESRVNKAVEESDISKLQDYLRETSGLASFPEAEVHLMQEFYNRGDLSASLAYAGRLINNDKYASLATSYLLLLEKEQKVPLDLRYEIPKELLSKSVKLKGKEVLLRDLSKEYRKELKASKGPGSLLNKVPLAADLKTTVDGRTSEYDWDPYFILRSQSRVIFEANQWFSSSPMGTEVSDSQGKSLWSRYAFTPADKRIQNSPRVYRGTVINNHYYNLNYDASRKSFSIQKSNLKGDLQWDSTYLNSFSNWEPCSIPYSKMDSQVILVVEKDRQAAPVFALAFIDLETGELESVTALEKIRDPFKEEGHYDIFRSLIQFDNFCEDREAIYLYSASGMVAKINAFEKRIEWVRAYPYKTRKKHEGDSFEWTNPARTASPYLSLVGDTLVHFDNASMTWYGLNPISGDILWENALDLPTYIHSRGEGQIIFSQMNHRGQHTLKALSLTTGRVMWQKHLGNISIKGEGMINQSELYLPVTRGLLSFDLKNKTLIGRKLLNITPHRVEALDDKFLLYGKDHAFLLKSDGQLPTSLDDSVQSKSIVLEQADDVDLKKFSNDGLISFPLTDLYFKERVRAYSLDNSVYSLIEYLNDFMLIKESTLVKGKYSPAKLVWQKRLPNFNIKGTKILSFSSGSVSILDAYELKSLFSYKAKVGQRIRSARWDETHLYVLCSDGTLKQYDLRSKKLSREFYLDADNFIVFNKRILSFSNNHQVKNKVYEITDKLTEIKTLDKHYQGGDEIQSNSFAQAWLTHRHLHVFDFKHLKMYQVNMGYNPHRSWRLSDKFAATNHGEFLDLSNGKSKKYNSVVLGNKGVIYSEGKDYTYASNRGLIKLERFSDTMKTFDDDLSKGRRFTGWCRELGDKLIVCSSKMRNIYNLKSGELISRQSIDGPHTDKLILSDHSLIKIYRGKAYLYNSLQLSSEKIAYSPAKIDSLFWQKVDPRLWHGKQSYPAPELEYRLSDNSKYMHLQVRFKGHEQFVNHLGWSLNSHRYNDSFFAEYTEKGNNIGQILDSNLKQPFKHYFSADGYEYLECKVGKEDKLLNAYDGVMSLELSLLDQGEKVGSTRFASTYQPNSSSRENSYATRAYECMDSDRYAKLESLYEQAKLLLVDGESLSEFIKARRLHHSVSANVKFLERLLSKHSKRAQAHNILSVLFIEYLRSINSDNFTDEEVNKAYVYSKALADTLGMKDYDRALSFCLVDFKKSNNPYILPTRAKLMGRGNVYLDLKGSLQFSASDGRVALPMGFFGDQLKELERIEFDSPRKFKPGLGALSLFHKGKVIPVIDQEGKAQSGLNEGNWKNAHYSLYDFHTTKRSKAWYTSSGRIRLKKLRFTDVKEDYQWDEQSLLLNLSCHPVSSWRAGDLLKKYIEIKGVDDINQLCANILANEPRDAPLLEAILKKYGEHAGKDLKNYQSLMSKARVPLNLRRMMALNEFSQAGWQQLGPIKIDENSSLTLSTKPETNINKSSFKLSDASEISFEPHGDNGDNYEGYMYLRKSFNSTSSSSAYLHIKAIKGRNSFNTVRIWHNGSILEDTVLNNSQYESNTIKIPLRKGKNSILIKYSFEHYSQLNLRVGNVYGDDLSYISR